MTGPEVSDALEQAVAAGVEVADDLAGVLRRPDDLPDCGTLTGMASTVLLTALGWALRKAEP